MTLAAIILLSGLLAAAALPLLGAAPWLFPAGMALAAAAPLFFVTRHVLTSEPGLGEHPLSVSILSGLGCVLTMIGLQRYGSEYQWTAFCSLAALVTWMLWQHATRRRTLKSRSSEEFRT